MATHSSTLAWKIPWTEEPGRLQPMGSKESGTTERLHTHTLTQLWVPKIQDQVHCMCCEVSEAFSAGISPSGCRGASAHPSSMAPPPGPPVLITGVPLPEALVPILLGLAPHLPPFLSAPAPSVSPSPLGLHFQVFLDLLSQAYLYFLSRYAMLLRF